MADATEKARERARELDVDIGKVEGTGQDGRVTVPDVEAFAERSVSEAPDEGRPEEQATAPESPAPEPPETVVLNPETGLMGYAFGDGFEAVAGQPYLVSHDRYQDYKKEKHNGLPVLVKT